MGVRAQVAQECLDVADVVVQMERAGVLRHHARIDPVGDIDVVSRQQRPHGIAQQRGMMARQRGHQQHAWIGAARRTADIALEVHQPAERLVEHDGFDHGDAFALDLGGGQIPGRFLVFLADAVHQLAAGGELARHGHIGQRAVRMGEKLGTGVGERRQGTQERPLHFVQLIQHRDMT
ncbi:Uncharacterised protein [Bordetella pertussis]|nr:Uncharacterised protein [Bordetella pertussis]